MGTWGTGLFSEDLACDVRDAYRDHMARGASAEEAKSRLVSRHGDEVADAEDGPVFWLALAATAHSFGQLDDALRQKALAIIASKTDLARWDDPKLQRARAEVLDRLAQRLQSPQKQRAAIKPHRHMGADWELGEVVGLKLASEDCFVLLHVVDFETSAETRYPVIQVLSWRRNTLPPTNADIESAAVASEIFDRTMACQFVLTMPRSRQNEARVVRWGLTKEVSQGRRGWLSRLLRGHVDPPKHSYAGFGAIDARCAHP